MMSTKVAPATKKLSRASGVECRGMDERRDLWWPSPTVDLGRMIEVEPDTGFATVHGATLERIQFSYESWGELNAAADNAVLIVHPLASDPHATGEFAEQPRGWWEPLIGPGRAIDTERDFVVCPNLLGGCYGTTGPRHPAPDGEPWLERFPLLTPLDLMRAQRVFLQQLGVKRLRMVVGPSMGGMIAWEWAIEAGDEVDQVVVVAAPLRTSPLQIGLNWLQRRGIELDLKDDEIAAKWGQMIARGVGMLSYRSPVGLEQRFGRDWFKKPGETLESRGVYNIESWLRHHGKKAVRRYDPYTYLLFSRVMDLHDVGENRGGVVSALDRIGCPVTIVGISTDQLYPAEQVRLGVEVLEHLGHPVTWELISSPHGHDAFLLETDQLGAILRGVGRPSRAVLSTAAPAEVHTARLGILGAGSVAATLLRLITDRRDELIERFGLRFDVAGVAEIDREKKLDPVFADVPVTHDPELLVKREDVDVLLDLTRGTGSLALVEQALGRGRSVVTPNKLLVREHGPELERLALDNGVRLAFHNSIAAGWPLLYSVERPMGRRHVEGIWALLSSTCNTVLEGIESGASPETALAAARAAELTEPDPDLDLSGWDTAQKLLILIARTCGRRFDSDRIPVHGITEIDGGLVRDAVSRGYRVKLIGVFLNVAPEPVLGVLPVVVDRRGHLGGVHGSNNAVVLVDRDGGEMVTVGQGAGHLPVATAVLGDLVGLFRPRQSWTGRYPRAVRVPREAEFARFLTRDDSGAATIVDGPREGAIPLLDSLIHPRGAGAPQ
jgi:homoserine O-acetyltransferase